MSRGLPVIVLENAAEALSAMDFAGLDRPGAGWRRPQRGGCVFGYHAAMKWLAAACLLLCVLCRIASGNLAPDAHGAVIDRDDPYGTAASAGKELRVGHKGLFFDRFDAGISDPVTGAETPRLWPGARHSGYARNRTLHCNFGRWNQPDPNMTGLPVQASLAYHGNGLRAVVQGFDLRGHYGDGTNIYTYLGNAPWTRSDPQGLESLGSLAVNMGVRAHLIGGPSGVFATMLLHDSGNDRLTHRDMAMAFAFGAGGEIIIGGVPLVGGYMAGRAGAAGEIGAGGRMLADDIVLQGSGLAGGALRPVQIIKVPGTGNYGGAAFLSPEGIAYQGIQHGQVANYLVSSRLWSSTRPPAGWRYGFINEQGNFLGSP